MRAALGLLLAILAGCAQQRPATFVRADGAPTNPGAFEVDRTICRGETQKANLASNIEDGIGLGPEGPYSVRGRAINDVFVGCMAQRGYVLKPQ